MDEGHACALPATIAFGEDCESVYVVTCEGVNPLKVKLVCAALFGSLLRTITVIKFPDDFVAA